MTLLQMLCRESGEVLRLILQPPPPTRHLLYQKTSVQEKNVGENLIFRRTVTDEIEVRQSGDASRKGAQTP